MELNCEAQCRTRAHIAESPKDRHGRHRGSLELGLDADEREDDMRPTHVDSGSTFRR